MKKFLALFLLLTVIITIAACARENEDISDGSVSESVSDTQNGLNDEGNKDSHSESESVTESEQVSDTQGWAERDEDATVVTGDHTPFY